MHPHTDCVGEYDPADPIASARRMIDAAHYSSAFRGSPVILCLSDLADLAQATAPGEAGEVIQAGES